MQNIKKMREYVRLDVKKVNDDDSALLSLSQHQMIHVNN
jgi:hypothetical protein